MAEKTCILEVSEERMEQKIITRQHLDAKHLKTFIETQILGSITDIKECEKFYNLLNEYQKENFQDESILFEILKLKAQKRLAEMQGMDNLEYIIEISRLEEIYDQEESTKIKNLIEKIKG